MPNNFYYLFFISRKNSEIDKFFKLIIERCSWMIYNSLLIIMNKNSYKVLQFRSKTLRNSLFSDLIQYSILLFQFLEAFHKIFLHVNRIKSIRWVVWVVFLKVFIFKNATAAAVQTHEKVWRIGIFKIIIHKLIKFTFLHFNLLHYLFCCFFYFFSIF